LQGDGARWKPTPSRLYAFMVALGCSIDNRVMASAQASAARGLRPAGKIGGGCFNSLIS